TKSDRRTGWAGHSQTQSPDEVLPEVHDCAAARRSDDLYDLPLLDPPHGRRDPRLRHWSWVSNDDRRPARTVMPGMRGGPGATVDEDASRVVVLSAVQAAGDQRTGRTLPLLVRDEQLTRAIRILDQQLRGECWLLGVDRACTVSEAVPLRRPSARKADGDRVLADDERPRDI